jgi:ABC-2 type transport system ATP-binding protein
MQPVHEARRLTKYYSAIPAIRNVSLSLEPGTILGLLGPNGSGKSTTVAILTGLCEPSAGQVWFDGHNMADRLVDYKARVGYVPEEAHLIARLLDLFGMTSTADQPISGYSKGMKQKAVIAAALLHDPDLLILDEPESGLDLTAGLVLRHLMTILASRGKAILYSSHVLDHVERLCAAVVVLHHGRIVAEGPSISCAP